MIRQCVVNSPIPSIPTVTLERSRRKTWGSREYPAPPGLPVEINVPGSSVADADRWDTSVDTGRISNASFSRGTNSDVLAFDRADGAA